ncbi:hypothetical protein BEH94_08955 [Candidatus Altiarchaeales archaeon WOR_SM1_SCG]|nr:hypothetical protein BEH94_08955 [Candidatus Altiarchaeales archaeon WOR_SM1_SCG]
MVLIHETEKPHETTYITISRDEYDSMKSTLEILADKELMESIRRGEEDIKAGRTTPLNDFIKELED